jgi:hypothetical protein
MRRPPKSVFTSIFGMTPPSQSHKSMGYNPELLIINYFLAVLVQEIYKSLVKAAVMATGKLDIIRACQKGGWKVYHPGCRTGVGILQREIMYASRARE